MVMTPNYRLRNHLRHGKADDLPQQNIIALIQTEGRSLFNIMLLGTSRTMYGMKNMNNAIL